MELWKKILIGVGIVLLIGVIWFFSTRNSLVTLQETVNSSWAQVENQLQRRYDLIPNLVNTVKGYAKHEKEIFENIAIARGQLAGAKSVSEKINAAKGVESAISRLLMVVENYPNLKADRNFTRLMDELAGAENRISVERRRFNENVKLYNLTIRKVPTNIVASIGGFVKTDYFEVEEAARVTPKVNFE